MFIKSLAFTRMEPILNNLMTIMTLTVYTADVKEFGSVMPWRGHRYTTLAADYSSLTE